MNNFPRKFAVVASAVLFAAVTGALAVDIGPVSASPAAPLLSVNLSSDLADGQTVSASGSGFAPGASIAIGECLAGATSVSSCSLNGASLVTADGAGDFTTPFTVSRVITIGSSTVDCSIVACVLGVGQLPALTTFATTPISFSPALAPPVPAPSGPGTPYYLALGDSLSTGFGAPSGEGYVDDLASHYRTILPGLQVMDLGCNGETTTSFVHGGKCPYAQGSQLAAAQAFLAAHQGQVAFVTIDIGGNDIVGCESTAPPFTTAPGCIAQALSQIGSNLQQIGVGLRSAAGSAVPIAGMNYFDPFLIEWLLSPAGEVAAQASVGDVGQLNSTLASGYSGFGAPVADVSTAFDTDDFSDLVGSPYGTIPKNVDVVCTWLLVVCQAGGPEIFGIHPNAAGYLAIAQTFEQVIQPAKLSPQAPTPSLASTASSSGLPFTGFPATDLSLLGMALVALGLLAIAGSATRRRKPNRSTMASPEMARQSKGRGPLS
jgi:lysophospholipase L1-like esterase